jgi:hypothetical protein
MDNSIVIKFNIGEFYNRFVFICIGQLQRPPYIRTYTFWAYCKYLQKKLHKVIIWACLDEPLKIGCTNGF